MGLPVEEILVLFCTRCDYSTFLRRFYCPRMAGCQAATYSDPSRGEIADLIYIDGGVVHWRDSSCAASETYHSSGRWQFPAVNGKLSPHFRNTCWRVTLNHAGKKNTKKDPTTFAAEAKATVEARFMYLVSLDDINGRLKYDLDTNGFNVSSKPKDGASEPDFNGLRFVLLQSILETTFEQKYSLKKVRLSWRRLAKIRQRFRPTSGVLPLGSR